MPVDFGQIVQGGKTGTQAKLRVGHRLGPRLGVGDNFYFFVLAGMAGANLAVAEIIGA